MRTGVHEGLIQEALAAAASLLLIASKIFVISRRLCFARPSRDIERAHELLAFLERP